MTETNIKISIKGCKRGRAIRKRLRAAWGAVESRPLQEGAVQFINRAVVIVLLVLGVAVGAGANPAN